MSINLIKKVETPRPECKTNVDQEIRHHEHNLLSDLEAISERSLCAKETMAQELLAMGLSKEAVVRILHTTTKTRHLWNKLSISLKS